MPVLNYDASFVSMFFGVIEMSGFAADAAISLEHDEDDWEFHAGVDGAGTRSKMSIKSATVTVSLEQTSAVNDLLSAHRTLDLNTPGGVGGQELIIKDNSGRTLLFAETAWIQKPPTAELNRASTVREWIFRTDNVVALHGGN